MQKAESAPWNKPTFAERLRRVGTRRYHDKHPFHRLMNQGRLSREAIGGWVANRFYYQRNIPIKDAAIVSNCPVREVRRIWIHRIQDHDGTATGKGGPQSAQAGEISAAAKPPIGDEGGIEAWLRLGEACGLPR